LTKTSQIATNYADFVWIGLTQANWPASDSWSWTDGTPFDFHTWSVGEPNDYKDAEHCGEFELASLEGPINRGPIQVMAKDLCCTAARKV
ncbi:hypothetical protein TELCIR_20909, partial [Teladorsagia circumcincta]